jgi:hypothetical protein
VAAGNDGVNTDAGDQATCEGAGPINPLRCSFPCNYDLANVVCVAASQRADGLATFSNFGTRFVDVAAPGEAVESTGPGGGWMVLSGTSMATPHVTGVAALLLARHPGLTVGELRAALLGSVDRTPGLAGAVAAGGRLDAPAALNAADALVPAAAPAAAAPPAPAVPAGPVVAARGPDRTAPALVLAAPSRMKLATALRRGVRAAARCSEACTLSFALVLDARTARRLHVHRTLARATRRLVRRGVATVGLRPPRALARLRSARLTLRVGATDAAGNTTVRARAIVLRR